MEVNCELGKEIEVLKETYNVRTLKNVESFKVVVSLEGLSGNISVEFSFTLTDPSMRPDVIVGGLDISNYDLQQLKSTPKNNYMLEFVQLLLDFENSLSKKNCKRSDEHKKHKGSYFSKINIKPSDSKKPSMKTTDDVINRILWDPNLETTDFTIGYLDRFLGIMEKNFTAFNWEDLASVDCNVLAIPKHRIQYFKYKNKTVWDKTKRIDNVFGSTGSGLTINDIIMNYVEDCDLTSNSSTCIPSEDEITILTGNECLIPKQPTTRPTYFLCQRILNTEVVKRVSDIQNKMLSICPMFEDYVILPNVLHCTLCTVNLESVNDVKTMIQILEDNREELMDLSSELQIEIENIGQFFNRVIYASVVPSEKLNKLVDYLKYIIQEGGIQISDLYDYVPHVTIMKMTHECKKKFPNKMLEPFINIMFGHQDVDEIHLCEISKNRDENGFYNCPIKINLNK